MQGCQDSTIADLWFIFCQSGQMPTGKQAVTLQLHHVHLRATLRNPPTPGPLNVAVNLADSYFAGRAVGVERRPHGGQQPDAGVLAEVHPGLLPPTS